MLKNSEDIRYILGIDPSGNFVEGKGITGWCVFDKQLDKVIHCGSIRATEAACQQAYWHAHTVMIKHFTTEYKGQLCVSIEDYVLYSHQAKAQINSAMETSQLIGVIKMHCWLGMVPLYIRTASQVKKRWTDGILCHKEYIHKVGNGYFVECRAKVLCDHERDAIRHAVHCATFELKEDKKCMN